MSKRVTFTVTFNTSAGDQQVMQLSRDATASLCAALAKVGVKYTIERTPPPAKPTEPQMCED